MRLNRSNFNLLAVAFFSCLLMACGGEDGDDLDQFMANAADNMAKTVEPLPEVLAYIPLQYNVDGVLTDPFMARKASAGSGSLQPNTNRPREALESFPLESLFYVGSLSKKRLKYALIKTPEETLQQVRVGNYLGPNFGLITAINDNAIAIKEVIQDDVTGDWVEREASINLQE
ncbi:MAG: pilus assembly protein PilP [Methylophilaceae bacterium]